MKADELNSLGILVGAGFAKWAAGLPVANELFDFEIELFGPRDMLRLQTVRQAWDGWLQRNPDRISEEFVAYAISRDEKLHSAVIWYITRRLSQPYIWREWHAGRWRRHVLMIDENRKYGRPGVSRVRDFLLPLVLRLSGIITPNYDLLVEYGLGTGLFNYGRPNEILTGRGPYPVSQWRNPVTLRGPIPVAKVHGSISWDKEGKYTDGRRGITGKALIVAPIPEKVPPPELAFEWKLSAEILERSRALLVFGFGFNPYDEALLAHLAHHGRNVKRLMLVDTNPKLDRARMLWPRADIQALSPPLENDNLEAWRINLSRVLTGS